MSVDTLCGNMNCSEMHFHRAGAFLVTSTWGENYGGDAGSSKKSLATTMSEAIKAIANDR
jgi:hypothetical protein